MTTGLRRPQSVWSKRWGSIVTPPQELAALEEVFSLIPVLDIGGPIIDRAIALRQARKMKLGDAIIAATALVAGLTLATHDADFANIPGLTVHDPLAQPMTRCCTATQGVGHMPQYPNTRRAAAAAVTAGVFGLIGAAAWFGGTPSPSAAAADTTAAAELAKVWPEFGGTPSRNMVNTSAPVARRRAQGRGSQSRQGRQVESRPRLARLRRPDDRQRQNPGRHQQQQPARPVGCRRPRRGHVLRPGHRQIPISGGLRQAAGRPGQRLGETRACARRL